MPDEPKNRSKWTDDEREEFEKFEGIPVRVVGFLVAVKPQAGSEEATNCRFSKEADTDWHMALVANAGDGADARFDRRVRARENSGTDPRRAGASAG